jgi:hypothetical protein
MAIVAFCRRLAVLLFRYLFFVAILASLMESGLIIWSIARDLFLMAVDAFHLNLAVFCLMVTRLALDIVLGMYIVLKEHYLFGDLIRG